MSATGTAPYVRGAAVVDAGARTAVALIDTAGAALTVSQALADELDLHVHEWLDDRGAAVAVVDPPALRVGDAPLDTEGLVAYAFEDTRPLGLAARRADLAIPSTVLRRHHVVLDAPAGTLTVGPPGSLERRGVAVPAAIDDGVVTVSVDVAGETVDLVLDSALTCCLAADRVLRRWQSAHVDWPASASSVGPANMIGAAVEARIPMLRVPLVEIGAFSVPQVAFAWRGDAEVTADGSLGGNVLDLFRVDIDHTAGSVRLEQGRPFAGNDTQQVGVVLALGGLGWEVAATVLGLDDVRPGDVLLAVDDTDVAGLALPGVLDLLRGEPGERRRLMLDRDDELLHVDAPVLRLL